MSAPVGHVLERDRAFMWMRRCALFAWELPQNTLGLLLLALQHVRGHIAEVQFERERVMVEIRSAGAISLGAFVFFTTVDNPYVPVGAENRDHEYGHSLQSRWLGPLYLPVVGLTSEMRVVYAFLFRHAVGKRWSGYYNGFPENWADRLGNVDTARRPLP